MTSARNNAMATLLANGKVLIAGGNGCDDPKQCTAVNVGAFLASAELYDPATGKFTRTGSMTADREGLSAATLLPDGKVLIVGESEWADVYDPSTGKFTRTGGTPVVRYDTATLLPNGKVLATGSSWDNDVVAQLYDESSGQFTTVSLALPPGTPIVKHEGHPVERSWPNTATLLPDGRVVLFEGGYLETYDPATGKCADAGYVSPPDSLYGEWSAVTATLLSDGLVLFIGGINESETVTAMLYDPTDGLTRTGAMLVARGGNTATLLRDDSVLITGGYDDNASNGDPLASAELFEP